MYVYAPRVSKAFTRDDAAAAPITIVLARAPLPPGVTNYVTPRGLALLRDELTRRQAERMQAEASAAGPDRAEDRAEGPVEHRAALAASDASLAELAARVASAVVVDPATQPQDEVRFGAQVTVRTEAGALRTYRLVGVDEADGSQGLVAFVSPLARALLGRRVGEVVTRTTPRGEEELELVAIRYGESPAPPDLTRQPTR